MQWVKLLLYKVLRSKAMHGMHIENSEAHGVSFGGDGVMTGDRADSMEPSREGHR